MESNETMKRMEGQLDRLMESIKELSTSLEKHKKDTPKEVYDSGIRTCISFGMLIAETLFSRKK